MVGYTNLRLWASVSLQYNQAMPREDGRTSWSPYYFVPDTLDPVSNKILILAPHGLEVVCEPE